MWQVPAVFRQRLGDQVGRQRAMEADGHLLLVTHMPPRADEAKRIGRFFWREPNGEWHASDLGMGPKVLTRHLDEFAAAIEKLETREEQATKSVEYFRILDELGPLARATRNLHTTLQQAREMLDNDRSIINARDRAYELERQVELLFSETKNSMDLVVAMNAEAMAASSHLMAVSAHRLNILAAFFFPIATLATLFGTNLQHGFEVRDPPWPFVALTVVGLTLGALFYAFVGGRRVKPPTDRGPVAAAPPRHAPGGS